MAFLSKTLLIGNLGRDVELRYSPDGSPVANLQLATTEAWKDRESGEKKEHTEWHRLVAFGRTAEVLGDYGKKGQQLFVEGKLRTRKWTDKDAVERYSTEIIVESFQFLGARRDGDAAADAAAAAQPEAGGAKATKRTPSRSRKASRTEQQEPQAADTPF